MHLSRQAGAWVIYPQSATELDGAGRAAFVTNPMPAESPIAMQSVVTIATDLVSSGLADEVVILNLRSGVYHGLEAVGARVWEMIQAPVAVDAVRDALLSEYDVEPARCEQDLLALIEDLKSHGLLEICSAAGGHVSSPEPAREAADLCDSPMAHLRAPGALDDVIRSVATDREPDEREAGVQTVFD
jgi:hypothetical protein